LLGYGNNFIFQDDGATCHRARNVEQWKEANEFKCLKWPPQSPPDLNPIENLWQIVKIELRNKHSHNLRELEQNAKIVWDSVRPESCKKLVKSMPRRIQAVLEGTVR
jgi:transposase